MPTSKSRKQNNPAGSAAGPGTAPAPDDLPPVLQDLIAAALAEGPASSRSAAAQRLLSALALEGAGMSAYSAPRHPLADLPARLTVRVDIVGARPPIWRRLDLASDLTLDAVHYVLQTVFDWYGGHLHHFIGGTRANREYFADLDQLNDEVTDESIVRIGELLGTPKDSVTYEYDFGDGWEHRIALEQVTAHRPGAPAAVCVAGRRRGPVEDSGGIWGYEHLCEVLADPSDPEHQDMLDWLGLDEGGDFDPAEFDVDDVNQALAELG